MDTGALIVTYVVKLPTSRLLARNDFRVARDLGVVERTLSQVRAAIFTVGLPRPRCTEDTALAVKNPCQKSASLLLCDRKL